MILHLHSPPATVLILFYPIDLQVPSLFRDLSWLISVSSLCFSFLETYCAVEKEGFRVKHTSPHYHL